MEVLEELYSALGGQVAADNFQVHLGKMGTVMDVLVGAQVVCLEGAQVVRRMERQVAPRMEDQGGVRTEWEVLG